MKPMHTDSGQDNPFRPDGDLSREADELVELLKGGRPISEVLKGKEESQQQQQHAGELNSSPRNPSSPLLGSPTKGDSTDGGRINGTGSDSKANEAMSGAEDAVEVQRGVVAAGEGQVEHVVIKKKSKCQCCVIQ